MLFDYGAVADSEPGLAVRLVRVLPGSNLAAGRHRIPVGWFAFGRANRIED